MSSKGNDKKETHQDSKDVDFNVDNACVSLGEKNPEVALETMKWDQEKAMSLYKGYEDDKIIFIKLTIGVYSVFITGLIAVFSFSMKKGGTFSLAPPFDILFAIALIGMGLIGLSLLKYVIWKRAEGIKTVRQMNCNRQAIDSIMFHCFEGRYPSDKQELKDRDTLYWNVLGKHRRLPTDNDPMRENQAYFFESLPLSPDNFLILVMTVLIFITLSIPILFLLFSPSGQSTVLGFISGVLSLSFLALVIWQVKASQKMIREAFGIPSEENQLTKGSSGRAKTRTAEPRR